jgi:hypothetical protein
MIRAFHLKTYISGLGLVLGFVVNTSIAQGGFDATLTGLNNTGGFSSYDTTNVTGWSKEYGSFSLFNAIACQIDWTSSSSSLAGLVLTNKGVLPTFCIEIPQDVYEGSTYNFQPTALTNLPTSGPPLNTNKIKELGQLWGALYSTLKSSSDYAAFQIAIWAIVYGNGNLADFSWAGTHQNGTLTFEGSNVNYPFTATGADAYTAFGWLENLANGKYKSDSANLVGFDVTSLSGQPAQDQLAELKPGYCVNPNGDIVSAPAPSALILALVGIVPCLALRRRLVVAKLA